MCGIIGVFNSQRCREDIETITSRLEYRGYDSVGMYLTDWNDDFLYKKSVNNGVVQEFQSLTNSDNFKYGIGHCRWASHGEVNLDNCHPHVGEKFILVHNGIVYTPGCNYKGKRYSSDSLALLALIEDEYKETKHSVHCPDNCKYSSHRVIDTLKKVKEKITGDNAILLICKDSPEYFYVLTTGDKELYLCLGKDKEYYISSDISSLSGFDEQAEILKGICSIRNIGCLSDDISEIVKIPQINFASTGMFNEIIDQAKLVDGKIDTFNPYLGLPVFIGCGSSYNAALFGRRCMELIAGRPAIAEYASEFKEYSNIYKNAIPSINLVAISQSGETKDTIDCLKDTKATVITNNKSSFLARNYQNIDLDCGLETGVAATKTFTHSCKKLLFGAALSNSKYCLKKLLQTIQTKIFREGLSSLLDTHSHIKQYVDCNNFNRCLFLGSGLNYPIAREGALKMSEIAYVPSNGMPSAEIKHGPIALVDNQCLSVFIIPDLGGYRYNEIFSNIQEVKSRGSQVMIVGIANEEIKELANLYIPVKSGMWTGLRSDLALQQALAIHAFSSILCTIPLQFLAYYTAIKLGYNPDRPRHLAKCVTV